MSHLLPKWSNSYASTKVGEGWLKLGALAVSHPQPQPKPPLLNCIVNSKSQ